ncbi:transposable element Tcb1 transposase [Trichonephila clavipes]|nr:transposable element Tcb1 transposase [Trichonephila clavipes]
MVWGAIAYNTRSPLVLIHRTMTAQCMSMRSSNHLCCNSHTTASEAIFQQDNARPHTATVLQECLRTVTSLSWPAQSPDLSPIEHTFDHLGCGVGYYTSLIDLEARLQQIWNEMSQDIIQKLYASMTDRIASCIRARGSSTGY